MADGTDFVIKVYPVNNLFTESANAATVGTIVNVILCGTGGAGFVGRRGGRRFPQPVHAPRLEQRAAGLAARGPTTSTVQTMIGDLLTALGPPHL